MEEGGEASLPALARRLAPLSSTSGRFRNNTEMESHGSALKIAVDEPIGRFRGQEQTACRRKRPIGGRFPASAPLVRHLSPTGLGIQPQKRRPAPSSERSESALFPAPTANSSGSWRMWSPIRAHPPANQSMSRF